ncbi:MAG: nicotinate-nucleotide--dimethylbenzimidazole phosphoribosyltransferase [Rhodobacteraceae bacterium]|nr:nicotinate-nucleotide--dimethylbenzimidazole phosphoribosyltransferase [Paracoccaceae bacterium]
MGMTRIQRPPASLAEVHERCRNKPSADIGAARRAGERNTALTKPPGSLGRLEDLAIWYRSWHPDRRRIEKIQTVIFAGNHGIAARGVSAYPADVTAQMVANFDAGGAAINQLVAMIGGTLNVVPLQLETPTNDFSEAPAMSVEETVAAFGVGWSSIDQAADLLILGEMGIGNTTSAAAICYGLFGGAVDDWIGQGTGVDQGGLDRKRTLLEAALQCNESSLTDPLGVLQCLGGREVAALSGALCAARHASLPVVLDGYIVTAAAAVLYCCAEDMLDHTVAGHLSSEQAHRRLLDRLKLNPLLDLAMRLGEGSGAAVAAQILKSAMACHDGMATFGEAGVSESGP